MRRTDCWLAPLRFSRSIQVGRKWRLDDPLGGLTSEHSHRPSRMHSISRFLAFCPKI